MVKISRCVPESHSRKAKEKIREDLGPLAFTLSLTGTSDRPLCFTLTSSFASPEMADVVLAFSVKFGVLGYSHIDKYFNVKRFSQNIPGTTS